MFIPRTKSRIQDLIHHTTVRALKRLRELDWLGVSPLLTVILVGQRNPFTGRGMDEVGLRSDVLFLQGLTADEAFGYAKAHVGRAFEENAMHAIAESRAGRNFLDLQQALNTAMARAVAAGRKRVILDDTKETAVAPEEDLNDLMKRHNLTVGNVARQLRKTNYQVQQAISNPGKNQPTVDEIKDLLSGIVPEQPQRKAG